MVAELYYRMRGLITDCGNCASHPLKHAPWMIIGLSYLPLVLVHLRNLSLDERYQHFPLVLLAVGGLLWLRRTGKAADYTRTSTALSVLLLVASVACSTAAAILLSPWLAFLAACLMATALLLDWQGRHAYRLVPIAMLLLLLLPLPMRMDDALVTGLQSVSSRWASLLLDFVGFKHLLSGHIIEVPGSQFLVEEACRGVLSLFATIALAALFAVCERRGLVHSLLLIASGVVWAAMTNVMRICAVVAVQLLTGVDLAQGWVHDALGVVVFALALYLLFCTDQALLFLLESGASPGRTRSDGGARETGLRPRPLRPSASLPVALLLLLVVGIPSAAVAGIEVMNLGREPDLRHTNNSLAAVTLPAQVGPWRRAGFRQGTQDADPTHGPHWAAWTYENGPLQAVVSVDYPFYSWHNLTVCYAGAGWNVDGWRVRRILGAAGSTAEAVEFTVQKPPVAQALVLFTLLDSDGRILPAPAHKDPSFDDWFTSVRLRLARRTRQLGLGGVNYQLQMVTGGEPGRLRPADKELERLYAECLASLQAVVQ